FGIDAVLAHAPRDELRHLGAEIDDEDFVVHRAPWTCPPVPLRMESTPTAVRGRLVQARGLLVKSGCVGPPDCASLHPGYVARPTTEEAPMDISLRGRPAMITGASKGLGLAMATRFAQSGADVALLARRPEVLEEAKAAVTASAKGKVAVFPCDVSKA